ncbi:HAMP domain-containing sensor histidine kinase [Geobacter sp. AOG1]|uniref:HAMP domain-containing sensor histidine kinase n=1 Tax=Geobacter sp. AOG1 TaxID=1566346 RepID=UPI001CC44E95|nr:HAMP domain-containing sensor histidine kinase [Geobacter sp. AOG1]GFE56357.1 two-component sensor histidine kinase [Geobacter sp. AOG1]
MPTLRLSLIAKLAISTSLVLLVFMALFAYINIETLQKIFLDEAVSDAENLSESIIKTTHHQMLDDDRLRAYQMIQEVGTQSGIESIRLINKDGRIIFSTRDEEIGTFVDKKAAACNMCHAGATPLTHASTMNRSRFFTNAKGKQVLGLAKAIYNEESCYTAKCHFHPENFRVLGVLDVVVSLDKVMAITSSYRYKFTSLTFFLLLLIWLSITLCTQALVSRPVKQLLKHTNLLARGELNSKVLTSSSDELGELATAFNTMTVSLKKARDELEDWGRNLEVKVEERTHQLKQIQDQLIRSEKLASLGELVAGIAHEINNPLTGILVFSSLVGDDPRLNPELKDDLEKIRRETQRCAKIVRGLLDFARESVPHKIPTQINGLIDASLDLVTHQSSFHDITVIREYQQTLPPVLVDPNQIEQVLVNMLLNASHAMAAGGKLTVVTGLTSVDNRLFISIRDTGCGIPDENLGKIFDPFFTTKENLGTGLGLAVSYGIVESHGGNIEVQSTVGVGTVFTIRLPLPSDGETVENASDGNDAGMSGSVML